MKNISLLISVVLLVSCPIVSFSQIVAPTGNEYTEANADNIFIPNKPANGWYLDKNKVKKEALMMFSLKSKKIHIFINNKTLVLNDHVTEFGFFQEDGLERKFQFLDYPKKDYFEIIGKESPVILFINYSQYESQNNNYGEVANSVNKLETTYYIKTNSTFEKIRLNKKDFLKKFPENPNLDIYLKNHKIETKDLKNIYNLIEVLNQK
jgi:hypothetical protein